MHDELVLASTARMLRQGGLAWRPQVGDWCTLIDGSHSVGDRTGLWLVVAADAEVGWITVIDAGAQWPPARIAMTDALWLPTIGQLKGWLRGRGYYVSTFEGDAGATSQPNVPATTLRERQGWAANILNAGPPPSPPSLAMPFHPHSCTARLATQTFEAGGASEVEAIAEVVVRILAATSYHALP